MRKEMIQDEGEESIRGNADDGFAPQKRSTFVEIDRKQEDKDVTEYQKTRDERLFEKIYKLRIQTLQIQARRFYYLMGNKEDMYGEFCACFVKAVMTYKKSRGTFNTWLCTLLLNCTRNLQIGLRAKKRLPLGVNPDAMGKFMLSLDYSYDGKNGSENTLKEILADKMPVRGEALDKMDIDETTSIMSHHNPVVKGFFKRLCDGNTIASLLKEYKTRHGKIKISRSQVKRLNGRRGQTKIVTKLIRANTSIQDKFSVLNYSIATPNSLHYTIELKKTPGTDMVMRTIRKLRKDKKNALVRISA